MALGDQYHRADAIHWFLTGATADGGTQSDPDLSLGNYRSSTRAEWLGHILYQPIANLQVDFVGPGNGSGQGSIVAVSADSIRWTAPGGSPGPTVTINNGETKMLESYDDLEAYIVVSRTSAVDLAGSTTVKLVRQFNNLVGMSNVTSAEASAGVEKVRCLCIKNMASRTVYDMRVWIRT